MTKQELIDKLSSLETKLNSKKVEDKFIGNVEFTKKRADLGTFIGKLENAVEAEIAQRLENLSPQFSDAIKNLNDELNTLNNLQKILTTIAIILDLAIKIFTIGGQI